MEHTIRKREIYPYIAGAIAGAVAPIVATRYYFFSDPTGTTGPIPEWTKWTLATIMNIIPIGGIPMIGYGAAAGAGVVMAGKIIRQRAKERKELEARVSEH
ncbi:MAG: hypothetical protein ACP5NS_01965 [Candidatus Pacearchaeota archaeon]